MPGVFELGGKLLGGVAGGLITRSPTGVGMGAETGGDIGGEVDRATKREEEFIDPNLFRQTVDTGVPGFEQRKQRLKELILEAAGQRPGSGLRTEQLQAAGMLRGTAAGSELADAQSRQLLDRNIAAQRAAAASGLPGQGGLDARKAALNLGAIGGQVAQQAAQAGIQDRTGAQKALGRVLATGRDQDLAVERLRAERIIALRRLELRNEEAEQAGEINRENAEFIRFLIDAKRSPEEVLAAQEAAFKKAREESGRGPVEGAEFHRRRRGLKKFEEGEA
jgi:hypothetical protein